jgi:hypothetical protein
MEKKNCESEKPMSDEKKMMLRTLHASEPLPRSQRKTNATGSASSAMRRKGTPKPGVTTLGSCDAE